jgi:hypothetical protein
MLRVAEWVEELTRQLQKCTQKRWVDGPKYLGAADRYHRLPPFASLVTLGLPLSAAISRGRLSLANHQQ